MHRLASLAALCCLAATAQAADVHLLTAARIHTSDPQHPLAEAMAWGDDGRLLAVGDAKALSSRWPDAERIDVGEATVIPGLIDAHGHFREFATTLLMADLVGTRDKAEVVARLRAFEKKLGEGDWLRGSGWDQNDWPDKAFPTVADLDAAFPDRPVYLERVDGHAAWVNSAALRALAGDPDVGPMLAAGEVEGGRVLRGADGRPSGVLVDNAKDAVSDALPAFDPEDLERAIGEAARIVLSDGMTGVHEMGVSRQTLAHYRKLADEGKLPLRIDAYANGDGEALADLCAHGPYRHPGGHLKMAGVKLYIDGALGSRGAALLADYSDDHGNRGLLVTEPAQYEAIVRKAHGCHLQVATHAIGDRGNRIVLDTYERVLGEDAKSDHRWRIEHAQIVAPEDIPRFAKLGIIASMQPTHATSDTPWAQDRLGKERLFGAYAWQRFLHSGAHLALGSDFPVESPDPRLGLYAAVTRQDRDGQPPGGWLPDQRLSPAEALRGFTADAAYAGFDEHDVGQLKSGLRADFVVLASDPLAVPASQIDDLRVESTWVDGKPAWRAEDSAKP
jgi:predicted amidohydrolase YtcJ